MPASEIKDRKILCEPQRLLWLARRQQESLLRLLQGLVELESPSDDKVAVDRCISFAADTAASCGGRVRRHRRSEVGDILEVRFDPPGHPRYQRKPILLIGHLDTVWPLGTLAAIPFRVRKGIAFGPGVYDMKAGAAIALTALSILHPEGLPHRPTTLLLMGDEKVGSHVHAD